MLRKADYWSRSFTTNDQRSDKLKTLTVIGVRRLPTMTVPLPHPHHILDVGKRFLQASPVAAEGFAEKR